MYPANGFTKGQVIDYYTRIAKYIVPHLEGRPITMKRFPNGVRGEYFYEKDAPGFTPKWIQTFPVSRNSVEATINYILINDLPTLVWSANMANLEMHPFLAKIPRIDNPTMVVFDLDPGEGADIINSCETALLVKDLLDRLELQSFAKVSGSKGIHLYVPLNTEVTYASTQPFAKSIAELLVSEHHDSIVSEMSKAKRKGKVFVDWSQNSEHKSTVAVYSLRAKGDLPFVAMPVTWAELRKAVKTRDQSLLFFEPEAAIKRVIKLGDLFAPLLSLKQSLPKPFLELSNDSMKSDRAHNVTSLETYRQKRNFSKTPEPPPSIPQTTKQESRRLFVIQKHAASHLHYDFRLEMGGTLKSWAVPKGPPYAMNERRLAMATEDHPMEYARFEGIIPKGEYGGGTVMVWDIGTYELIDGNYWKGKLHFFLNGKKLKGEWILVKGAPSSGDGRDNTWYLIKGGTGTERPSEKEEDSSALTGRGLKEIAEAQTAIWHSNRNGGRDRAGAAENSNLDLESLPDAQVKFIEPMSARTVTQLPDNPEEWTYEIKLDGYRCLAARTEKGVTLWSRRKNVLTQEFPEIARACELLELDTLLDGEIVALDKAGRPSFNILQNFRSKAQQIQLYAFDLLVYRGKSLIGVPLEQRHTD